MSKPKEFIARVVPEKMELSEKVVVLPEKVVVLTDASEEPVEQEEKVKPRSAFGTAVVLTLVIGIAIACFTIPIVACTTAGQSALAVFYQKSTVEGQGEIGSMYIGLFAWTYPIRWNGRGSLTLQYPAVPYILLEGDLQWEPVYPQHTPNIQTAIARGHVVVRNRNNQPVALSPAGSLPRFTYEKENSR